MALSLARMHRNRRAHAISLIAGMKMLIAGSAIPGGMDFLDLARLVLATALLVLATRQDLRERMAEDYYWIVMGGAGLLLLAYQVIGQSLPWEYLLLVLGVAILFIDIFWERPWDGPVATASVYLISLAMIAYPSLLYHGDSAFWPFLTVPILYLAFMLMYMFDVIKGGADAKCMIALAILFPHYPALASLPLIDSPLPAATIVMPFALMVLFHAALFTVLSLFYFLQRNMRAGDIRFPQLLLGYRLSIDDARAGYYWPMERVEDGKVRIMRTPQSGEEEIYTALESLGRERVWVTPKIPFLLPITMGLLFVALVGNLLFLMF